MKRLNSKAIRDIIYPLLNSVYPEALPIRALYAAVENSGLLNDHDRGLSSPNHKRDQAWKRNIRNVIQSDKRKGWLELPFTGTYRIGLSHPLRD
tara:strand:+ start:332 stop:613 length:282 start_codon:yes stop_codon:yes gene_type:complete